MNLFRKEVETVMAQCAMAADTVHTRNEKEREELTAEERKTAPSKSTHHFLYSAAFSADHCCFMYRTVAAK